MRRSVRGWLVAGGAALFMVLAACNGSTQRSAITTSTLLPTQTSVATATTISPTATPAQATCAALLPGGILASAGSNFTDVSFPPGTISTALALDHHGDGQWSVYHMQACAEMTSVSLIQAFYATNLPAQGWANAPTEPFDGSFLQACGDAYCWDKDAAPRYVGLGDLIQHGTVVTYTLRLFVPPAVPNCAGTPAHGSYIAQLPATYSPQVIPLPPLTRDGLGMNGGNAGNDTGLCSAGTASALQIFFNAELTTRLHWSYGPFPARFGSGCAFTSTVGWWNGNEAFAFDSVTTVPNGVSWTARTCLAP